MNQPDSTDGRTCWFLNSWINCPSGCESEHGTVMFLNIATDGHKEWINCPICGKVWDAKTLEEINP